MKQAWPVILLLLMLVLLVPFSLLLTEIVDWLFERFPISRRGHD